MIRKTLITATAVLVAALAIACGSSPEINGKGRTLAGPSASAQPAAPATTQAATPTKAAPTTQAAPAGPATTITDGTWTVGEDIAAGTYKTTGSDSNCYWSITKTGSNGQDIINNHIGGGNLRVTLKVGQDFESARCGTWTKV